MLCILSVVFVIEKSLETYSCYKVEYHKLRIPLHYHENPISTDRLHIIEELSFKNVWNIINLIWKILYVEITFMNNIEFITNVTRNSSEITVNCSLRFCYLLSQHICFQFSITCILLVSWSNNKDEWSVI